MFEEKQPPFLAPVGVCFNQIVIIAGYQYRPQSHTTPLPLRLITRMLENGTDRQHIFALSLAHSHTHTHTHTFIYIILDSVLVIKSPVIDHRERDFILILSTHHNGLRYWISFARGEDNCWQEGARGVARAMRWLYVEKHKLNLTSFRLTCVSWKGRGREGERVWVGESGREKGIKIIVALTRFF